MNDEWHLNLVEIPDQEQYLKSDQTTYWHDQYRYFFSNGKFTLDKIEVLFPTRIRL